MEKEKYEWVSSEEIDEINGLYAEEFRVKGFIGEDRYRFNFLVFDEILEDIYRLSLNPLRHTLLARELEQTVGRSSGGIGRRHLTPLVECGALSILDQHNNRYMRYRINKEWFNNYFENRKKWSCEKDE